MARFRLSSDIISPLNSDISLNDGSTFSFGSFPGTPPVFDSNFASPIRSTSTKDTDISLLYTKTMKESANACDEITNDIKKQLSLNIISPLNSDISLNDGSKVSFGSFPGTPPVFKSNFASPICSTSTKDTDVSLLYTKTMKECANAYDEITNDIKKQSSLNSEKEEKYNETFEILKRSMDDLFHCNESSSVPSPQLMKKESKNKNLASKAHSKINTIGKFQDSKNLKSHKKNTYADPVNMSETTEKKSEKCKMVNSVTTKPKKNQHPSKSSSSESVKGTKNKCEIRVRNNAEANQKKDTLNDQKKNLKRSSKNDKVGAKVIISKILPEESTEKGTENVKGYDFKCQKKIPVSNDMPIVEQKSLSIEKLQLAVSMEMDNIRRFVQDQNLYVHKDLLKLQEMAKKQNEVTEYLFSVIDELVDTNKKLISKLN